MDPITTLPDDADDEDQTPPPKTIREIAEHFRYVFAICWELAQSQRHLLLVSYLSTLAIEGLGLALSWLVSQLIARASERSPNHSLVRPELLWPLLGILALWLATISLDYLRETRGARARAQLEHDLPLQALDRLLRLHRGYHQDNNTGHVNAKVTRGSAYVSGVLNLMQFNLLPRLTLLAATIVILCVIHPAFTVFTLTILGLYGWLLLVGRLDVTALYDVRERLRARAERRGSELVDNVNVVQAFHQGRALHAGIGAQRDQMLANEVEENRRGMRNWVTRALGGDLIQWLMLLLAIFLQQTGRLSLSVLLFTVTLVMRYRQELFNFGWMYDELMRMTDAIIKLRGLLNEVPKIVDPVAPLPLPTPAQAHLVFEDVSYRYPGSDGKDARWALRNISLEIRPGEVLGIAGHSGHGKSTFLSLISRTDDPTEGRVLLNGVDLRQVRLGDLRGRMAVVEQDPRVFNDTIFANVDFGRGFSQEAVEAACKMAGAHEFILNGTPKGYQSRIGDRGTKLSGGQKQRLCLARALLGQPSLLILDEATSSIDPHSIELIMQSMERLKGRCTIVLVSHQLSTLQRLADRIAVINDGQIAEIGTHAQLLLGNGLYHKLVRIQQKQEQAE